MAKKKAKKVVKKKVKKAAKKAKASVAISPFRESLSDQAGYSLDTLVRAEEIKGDTKLMKAIEAEKKKRINSLKNIGGKK